MMENYFPFTFLYRINLSTTREHRNVFQTYKDSENLVPVPHCLRKLWEHRGQQNQKVNPDRESRFQEMGMQLRSVVKRSPRGHSKADLERMCPN